MARRSMFVVTYPSVPPIRMIGDWLMRLGTELTKFSENWLSYQFRNAVAYPKPTKSAGALTAFVGRAVARETVRVVDADTDALLNGAQLP